MTTTLDTSWFCQQGESFCMHLFSSYNDNNLIPAGNSEDFNKCYKIQPLVDYIREKFFEAVIPETYVAVDEQVIPFKGASSLKRCLPKKPKKWGYKLWALAGVSGYVYTFEVDGGKGKMVLQMGGMHQISVAKADLLFCT